MTDTIYRTHDGDMLDEICWRHYDHQAGVVEQVLERNPRLAALGPIYSANVLITLPEIQRPVSSNTIQLWD